MVISFALPDSVRNGTRHHTLRQIGLERRARARHIFGMNQRRPPDLDMTINGEFVSPRKVPVSSRILMWAVVVAVLAGALSLAAFTLWLALMILPVAIGAAVVAWVMFRYRVWRARRATGHRQNVWRP